MYYPFNSTALFYSHYALRIRETSRKKKKEKEKSIIIYSVHFKAMIKSENVHE